MNTRGSEIRPSLGEDRPGLSDVLDVAWQAILAFVEREGRVPSVLLLNPQQHDAVYEAKRQEVRLLGVAGLFGLTLMAEPGLEVNEVRVE